MKITIERGDGKPPETIGREEDGTLYFWAGALSGWRIEEHYDTPYLIHRCGFEEWVPGEYLANMIVKHVIGHRCR